MKKYLLLMLVVLTGIVSSCKYDDDELWGSVDDLANRVSALETLTKQMNSDISALQAVITAVQNQVAVSEVEKLTDGYILHFTNGTTATIKNGTDGKDGANGENGADGEDGKDGVDGKDGKDAPAIGVAKDGDVYYWTITVDGKTEWLTDDAGNQLPVTGGAGSDGSNGSSGSSGSSGTSGKTPQLSFDKDGYWMVSYGGTPDYIRDASGNKILAKGVNGVDGVAQFSSVSADNVNETVTIVKADGATFVLPLVRSIRFYSDADKKNEVSMEDIKGIELEANESSVTFWYTLEMKSATITVADDANVDVDLDETDKSITFTLTDRTYVTDTRAVILFHNESQTLTSVFKFKNAPWDGQSASDELVAVEGEPDVLGIATPADLKLFANMVNEVQTYGGRAASDEPITYKLLNDIDLSNHPWEPIGLTREKAFTGTFDGNGKTIKGLKVVNIPTDESGSTTGAGLFGVIENATVKGLAVKDAKVELENEVEAAGLIVGRAYGSVTFEDIVVENTVTVEEDAEVKGAQNVGSVAGIISGSDVTIKGCEVKSTDLASSSASASSEEKVTVGGVVGLLEITNDGSGTATLNIEGCKVGGIELSASTSESTGESSTSAGGVVGALKVEETVNLQKNIVGNSVSNAETDPSVGVQGPIIGNMAELAPEISADIIKDNHVSEDVQIETQLTVDNLEAVLQSALKENGTNSFNVKGNITTSKEINIPAEGVDVTLNFDALATTQNNVLTIKQGTGSAAVVSSHKLIVHVPTTDAGQYLNILAPETTVTLVSGNYAEVTALTAQNTLVVEKGVTIERLEIEDGGVDVYGYVKTLVRAEGYTGDVTLTIMEGGKVDSVGEGFDLLEGNPGAHELALKEAAKKGGSFTVTEKLRLTSPLIVTGNFTLNFSNGAFWGDEGQFVDSKGWKAMVVVMPGATFTYNGGGEFNTGHKLTQLSCIRMVGGSDAPSKVIMNDGNLIGTYHAILIDEDCQNAEVEINGGTLSCDWWNEFHGVNIFNKSDAKITIKGGNLTTFTDTKISCVEMWGGELNISGGQFNTTLTEMQEGLNVNPNVGNTLIGPAIAIAPKRDVTVNISGGTFTGNGSSSFLEKIVDSSLLGHINVNLSIIGGTFDSAVTSQDCQGFISGGKFKVQPKDIYLVEGKSTSLKGDYFEIVEGAADKESGTTLPSWDKENWGNN